MNNSQSPAQIYESFLVPSIFTPWAEMLIEKAKPGVGEHVLDLACGTGIVSRKTAPVIGEKGKIVAVDINPDMLGVGSTLPPPKGAAIEWREGNAVSLDLKDGNFDLLFCQQGLQFFPDRRKSVSEMKRVLKDKGRAILMLWRSINENPLYKILFETLASRFNVPVNSLEVPFSLSDEKEITSIFNEAGFSRTEIIPKNYNAFFPDAAQYIKLSTMAASAVIPSLAALDPAQRSKIVEEIRAEFQPEIEKYREGSGIRVTVHTNIIASYA